MVFYISFWVNFISHFYFLFFMPSLDELARQLAKMKFVSDHRSKDTHRFEIREIRYIPHVDFLVFQTVASDSQQSES